MTLRRSPGHFAQMIPLPFGTLPDLSTTLERFFAAFGVELETARAYGVRILIIWLLALAAWVGPQAGRRPHHPARRRRR